MPNESTWRDAGKTQLHTLPPEGGALRCSWVRGWGSGGTSSRGPQEAPKEGSGNLLTGFITQRPPSPQTRDTSCPVCPQEPKHKTPLASSLALSADAESSMITSINVTSTNIKVG